MRDPLKAAFNSQKANAKYRGVPFELTFEQWLGIWKKSRKLHLRGCKKGQYVMAREGDRGAYAVGNVSIILASLNCAEGKAGRSPLRGRVLPEAHRLKVIAALTGRPCSQATRDKISATKKRAA